MASTAELMRKFPYIVLWGRYMQSKESYIIDECADAASDSTAPFNAIYWGRRENRWVTTDDIKNVEIILEWDLSCTECGGTNAKRKGCTNYRHDIFNTHRPVTPVRV